MLIVTSVGSTTMQITGTAGFEFCKHKTADPVYWYDISTGTIWIANIPVLHNANACCLLKLAYFVSIPLAIDMFI